MTEPLRHLTHKEAVWNWSEEQECAFIDIKRLVTCAPVLSYYDPSKALVIECDASSKGLGAALLQDGKPIEYASRSLTDSEQRYAQIEKECLAIVYALERFHQYTFGRMTMVETDHKPIESIVKKPLSKAPKRLQSMLLRMSQYDTEIRYKQGSNMHIADLLSRDAYTDKGGKDQGRHDQINAVGHLCISKERLAEFRRESSNDETLTALKRVIIVGWPETKNQLPAQLSPYFTFRDELTVHDGLIFKGEQVIVPESMRSSVKDHLHLSHLGNESMLRRARECIYWPGMSTDIKHITESCEACQTFSRSQQKETLLTEPVHIPWEKIGVDLFCWNNQSYLITVDYFSNWWEIDRLFGVPGNNAKLAGASAVIRALKLHFARFGIPSVVVSDNGPQFIS